MVFKTKNKARADILCAIARESDYTIGSVKYITTETCAATEGGIANRGDTEEYYEIEILE